MNILLIDNYDSFTYNLYQQIARVAGCLPEVVTHDGITAAEIEARRPDLIVLSPGPGRPEEPADFGVCAQVLQQDRIPVLGVCLGFQGMVHQAGGRVVHAPLVMHGRLSRVFHVDADIFSGLPQGFEVVRYHSLMADTPLPDCLRRLAWTRDGIVMAAAHRHKPQWGVQFHPESVCSRFGDRLIAAVLQAVGGRPRWEEPGFVPRRWVARVPTPLTVTLDAAPPAEWVYAALFAHKPRHFWLDSSAETGGARYSFMGDASAPGAFALTYDRPAGRIRLHGAEGVQEREGRLMDFLSERLAHAQPALQEPAFPFQGGFVGYLGYELKGDLGVPAPHASEEPDAALIYATCFLVFDHLEKRLHLVAPGEDPATAQAWFAETRARLEGVGPPEPLAAPPAPQPFRFDRDRARYLEDIEAILARIHEGDTYEVCLTNRLTGRVPEDPVTVYRRLRRDNPAPYAACLRFDDLWVLSSSPEQFLRLEPTGAVRSKPIKGTRARHPDPRADRAVAMELASAEKDRSENLMIADLLRNDLGRVCQVGSVRVPKLMDVESFATVHQLVTTVTGLLRPDADVLACLAACFPGGSMTGAPKRRTMELIDALEGRARGVYSGCIGYMGLHGGAELSIVIRTAVLRRGEASIGTGGAVVAMSDPDAEHEETVLKAAALLRALGGYLDPDDPGEASL